MKKIFTIFGVLLILLGCSGVAKPMPTVEGYLNAYKKMDVVAMNKYRVSQNDTDASTLAEEDNPLTKLFLDLLTDLDYKLSNETIDGEKATVDIEVMTYDFQLLMANVISEYFNVAFGLALSGASDEMMEAKLNEIFIEKSKETEKNKNIKATIQLSKIDNEWKIDDEGTSNRNFMNAITGNLISVMESFDQAEE